MREYATLKTGPFVSVGVASYAYFPVVGFLSEDGQRTIQRLLDSPAINGKPEISMATSYQATACRS